MYSTLLALAILGAAAWLWRDSLRAREAASRISRRACEAESVQYLDDTVSLAAIRLVIDHGRPVLRRVYQFEFSRRGDDRQRGSVTLTGTRLETLFLTPPPADPPLEAGTVVELDPARRRH